MGLRRASPNFVHADVAGGRVDVLVEDPGRIEGLHLESVFAFRNERYVKELKFTVTASMFVWRSVFEQRSRLHKQRPGGRGLV